MRNKFIRFMYGRYGNDELNSFLTATSFGLMIASVIFSFLRLGLLYSISRSLFFIAIIFALFRMMSKNHPKRFAENQKFVSFKYSFLRKYSKEKDIMAQRKDYHFYRCPSCGQRIRIPRGHGRIEVTCPKCRTSFIKRS